MELQHPSTAGQIVPTIYNVNSTVNLGCEVDLYRVALEARNVDYTPSNTYAEMSIRGSMGVPMARVAIFASGRMVSTGAKTEADSKLALRKCARAIQKRGYDARFKDFKIQSIVGSCDVRFPIRLEDLAHANPEVARYRPEQSPTLTYSLKEPKVTLYVLKSGRVVITGAKCRKDMDKAFEVVYPVLEEFKEVPDELRKDLNKAFARISLI